MVCKAEAGEGSVFDLVKAAMTEGDHITVTEQAGLRLLYRIVTIVPD